MNIRRIELPCKSGDGSTLYVMQEDTRAEGSELPDYVILRTTGGQPVHVTLRDARELAGWLIEHAAETPAMPICGAVSNQGFLCVVAPGQTHGWHHAGDADGTCWKNE